MFYRHKQTITKKWNFDANYKTFSNEIKLDVKHINYYAQCTYEQAFLLLTPAKRGN